MTETRPTRFQSFTAASRPEQGPPRLTALRDALSRAGLDGVLVPRADAHQGEYVAACDERLAWLTGFTGSAGFAAVLARVAGIFVDGRYRVQVREQVDTRRVHARGLARNRAGRLADGALPDGGSIGFDPWLHTSREIDRLEAALSLRGIALRAVETRWTRSGRPARPAPRRRPWPSPPSIAGQDLGQKRAEIAANAGRCRAIGGGADPARFHLLAAQHPWRRPAAPAGGAGLRDPRRAGACDAVLGPGEVRRARAGPGYHPETRDAFEPALAALTGPVRLDPATAPHKLRLVLEGRGGDRPGDDPCILPKARKTRPRSRPRPKAHIRDGAAFARFLHWLDDAAPKGGLTEIDCVRALEDFRAETGALRDISFDTISAAGPHAALPHYRVTEASNAPLCPGQIYLVDSGGQYEDGTTDITRTIAIGTPGAEERGAFTQVLRGMIAVSRARFPKGIAGRDLDSFARMALWQAGRDFDHGTGHGVGVYLSVHEGPQRISRASTLPLEPGMILSNEPGYYREGAFGIRIENLVVVRPAPALPGGDARDMLCFDTLTWAPIDRRLIDAEALTRDEIAWIDAYHAQTAEKLRPHLPPDTADWLARATAPL